MEPAASISRLGFRKWYERQLIDSHACFVTCFLCMLMVAISLEQVQVLTFSLESLFNLGIVFVCLALGWASWRRYHRVLSQAEFYAEFSYCPQCKAYGVFKVLSSGRTQEHTTEYGDKTESRVWMNVSCKRCSAQWRLPS